MILTENHMWSSNADLEGNQQDGETKFLAVELKFCLLMQGEFDKTSLMKTRRGACNTASSGCSGGWGLLWKNTPKAAVPVGCGRLLGQQQKNPIEQRVPLEHSHSDGRTIVF